MSLHVLVLMQLAEYYDNGSEDIVLETYSIGLSVNSNNIRMERNVDKNSPFEKERQQLSALMDRKWYRN